MAVLGTTATSSSIGLLLRLFSVLVVAEVRFFNVVGKTNVILFDLSTYKQRFSGGATSEIQTTEGLISLDCCRCDDVGM